MCHATRRLTIVIIIIIWSHSLTGDAHKSIFDLQQQSSFPFLEYSYITITLFSPLQTFLKWKDDMESQDQNQSKTTGYKSLPEKK